MAEYIEREYLLEDIDASMTDSGMGYIIGQILKRYVNRQTPADVAPVRHGRWHRCGRNLGECSNCGEIVNIRYNYCPNCGCKMLEDLDGKK